MGRTKALIEVDGVPMGRRVASTLQAVGCTRVIASGGEPDELRPLTMTVVPDPAPGQGPVAGVLGALEHFQRSSPGAHVFVAACDLPGLTAASLRPMVVAARRAPLIDVVVAETSQVEPACAIWSPASTPLVRRMFDAGERALHEVIEQLDSVCVAVDADAIANINTPDDLRRYS